MMSFKYVQKARKWRKQKIERPTIVEEKIMERRGVRTDHALKYNMVRQLFSHPFGALLEILGSRPCA